MRFIGFTYAYPNFRKCLIFSLLLSVMLKSKREAKKKYNNSIHIALVTFNFEIWHILPH